jgi:hypothetical protein
MTRIDAIETELIKTIQDIDGSQKPTYKYYTQSGTVQIFDEVLSLARNTDLKMVNHYVDQLEDEGISSAEFDAGQWAYTLSTIYEIKSKVHNLGDEANSKNAIRTKMNEVLSDLLYAFGQNNDLDGKVAQIKLVNATRDYTSSNNRIQSGTLVTRWDIIFSQSILNPDIPACI